MNPCKNPLWNPPAARTARSRTRPPQNLAFWCALALEPPVLEFLGARTARPGTHTPPEPPVLGRPAARTARSTSRPPQNLSFWCALALEPSVLEFPFTRAKLLCKSEGGYVAIISPPPTPTKIVVIVSTYKLPSTIITHQHQLSTIPTTNNFTITCPI